MLTFRLGRVIHCDSIQYKWTYVYYFRYPSYLAPECLDDVNDVSFDKVSLMSGYHGNILNTFISETCGLQPLFYWNNILETHFGQPAMLV